MDKQLQSFNIPGKLYFKQGSLPIALRELKFELHRKRVFVIADETLLHSGRLSLVTNILAELGLFWSAAGVSDAAAQQCEKFEPDCIIAVGEYQATICALDLHKHYKDGSAYLIVIPTAIESLSVRRWLRPNMIILDEDICDEPQGEMTVQRILSAARDSLRGGNASDYTLAWAVQAMRMVFDGDGSKSTLLHAAALSRLAYAVSYTPDPLEGDLLPDAAEALGMTPDALEARINDAIAHRNQ